MTANDAAERRAAAARRWRPDVVRLLLVDEAPPSAPDRYFYFSDVDAHDSLFRYVVRGVLGVDPSRDKEPLLAELRDAGVFLVDASPTPFHDRRAALPACLPDLVRRIRALRPEHVLLVGAPLYDAAYRMLRAADLPVVGARLPYPGSGQQRRFLDALGEVLDALSD